MTGSPLFGILVIVSTAVFAVGVASNVLFWLQGNVGADLKRQADAGAGLKSAPAGLFYLLTTGLRGLAMAKVWRSLLVDVALQRRLWRLSRLRWLMQVGFIWGTAELFFVGSLGNMLAEKGIVSITKDTPWFALANEIGAVLVLLGVGITLYRRFISREIELPTSPGDAVLVVLLATTVLSGIFVEAARLLSSGVSGEVGWYSFIGYAIAEVVRSLASDWSGIYAPIWWFHIVVSFSLVAYLPFSKLFHLFVSPIALAASALER